MRRRRTGDLVTPKEICIGLFGTGLGLAMVVIAELTRHKLVGGAGLLTALITIGALLLWRM